MITELVNIVEVYTDDWYAIYVNEIEVQQGHSIHISALLELLVGGTIISYNSYYIDSHIVENEYGGTFPYKLSSIKKEYLN